MAVPSNKEQHDFENKGIGITLPFEAISEPGAYICNWSGHLLRMPEDSIKPGRSPLMSIKGTGPLFVTKISHDPFVQVSKARLIAADCDVPVNF
ncbi:MAG: hypothetical protein ACE5F9_13880 [Phycisphaerae bacterium]